MMIKRMLVVVLALSMSVVMGCQMSTVQKGAAGGAAVGAVVGGVWASAGGNILSAGEGALVGAAGGGLTGALVGEQLEDADNYQCLSKKNAKLSKKIDGLREEVRGLKAKLAAAEQELKNKDARIAYLEKMLAQANAELAKCRGARMELALDNNVLFASGSARLTGQGRKILDAAAKKIKANYLGDYDYITIEGHTDNVPIGKTNWKDNWDLGSARAMTVTRYLINQTGLDAKMFGAASYSKYQPVASNDTADGKAKNRRSIIVLHTGWPRF